MNYFFVMFVFSLLMLFIFNNYFLMVLISLEFLVLSILLLIFNLMLGNDWLFMVFLVMAVCESVLGIALMVSMVYMFGDQGISLLNMKW